ncbi:glucose-6-phosphate isomerase [Actinorugispora endophytica]|uniref:Glucose-6-phosphate isomerase n=1 Tax=Actinorugispora endophytica TaxID=1605990 RepID=A0A4R6UPK1_9ACTN|nr:glucose-6-phosphate isomerase [Actinorugispora endophytica]TDQ47589.1 glucose-6-phosphate isomerase [Actinorugispora endophytica]
MSSDQVQAGGLTVTLRGAAGDASRTALETLGTDGVAARLAAKDATLWGPGAEAEASVRLGWVDLAESSRALLPRIREIAEAKRAAGLDRVVLAGMGGSSLAPEVIAASRGADLVTLDTTDAHQVRRAIGTDLARTVVVVSSKSGGTVETDSHRRAFEQAFTDAGIDPAERVVVVTDPGSPLAGLAAERGYETVLADPDVGGRYSALTAFGLVPSALAGVDVEALLDEAAAVAATLADDDNPALALGAVLGGFGGHDKVVLAGRTPAGLGDWIEQLVAESTGKSGTGLLPVVVEGVDAPGFTPGPDTHLVVYGEDAAPGADTADTLVTGPLGGQFLAWEYATAVAGRLLGIDPFDQPNVQESKDNTKALLESSNNGTLPTGAPLLVDGAVEVHASDPALLGDAKDLAAVLQALVRSVPEDGYLAVMAYLDRDAEGDGRAATVRSGLAALTPRPVTFGWGPRFLHSTGQYHKGGPANGVFAQITGEVTQDLPVPGRPYSFARLQLAQALGDFGALAERGRPAIRLHLRDRVAGLEELSRALGAVRP